MPQFAILDLEMYERYSRQILFPEIGRDGQEKLLASRVLVVGCGALGASHSEMLARAGVGKLRIVDRDFVELTNLQRQTLFSEADAAERLPKAVAARKRIAEINSGTDVEAVVADVNNSNIESLMDGCDVVIDGTDNFQVRYLVNDACVKLGVPWIYGAAVASFGTTMTVRPGVSPCLRCIFEEMPDAGSSPTCDTAGVIMPIIASISAIQVAECLKLIVDDTDMLHSSLVQIDIWANDRQRIKLSGPVEGCRCCGLRIYDHLDAESREFAAALCGRDAVQVAPPAGSFVGLAALADRLKFVFAVTENEYIVRFNADGHEVTVFADGRAIIKGIDDPSAARGIYAKYIGT
ncbi:MAG: ThiF family adenylyltransferase [Pyrinomonadaceae bacterium]|nr:ThiF family adenylyltransferase [Pyrinomonadaceae bacterium]